MTQSDRRPLVIEIGTEEIPAGFLMHKESALSNQLSKLLDEKRIAFDSLRVMMTPRRLAFLLNVAGEQSARTEAIKGPPLRIARTDQGEWSKAARGFAKKQSMEVEALKEVDMDGETFLVAEKTWPAAPTVDCLPELIQDLIEGISWPKSMRWEKDIPAFARPIRWILAVFGKTPVAGQVYHLPFTSETPGLRTDDQPIEIQNARDYVEALREREILADHHERETYIRRKLTETIKSLGGDPERYSRNLLREITFIVECPTLIVAEFPESFLYIPAPVLLSAIEVQQRYFPVMDESGRLKNAFLIVANGKPNETAVVKEGNERVLQARLKDGEFFYREDRKMPLLKTAEGLAAVTFQKGLGSLKDRFERMGVLMKELADALYPDTYDADRLNRTAALSKADLITEVVKEFPHLQGIMGEVYAREDGETDETARAIREQYLPRGVDDDLPETELGTLLSLADKLDLMIASLAIGARASGSADPMGLRRAAIGMIRILTTARRSLSLSDICSGHLGRLQPFLNGNQSAAEIQNEILAFVRQRLLAFLKDQGHRTDIVEAVLLDDLDDVADAAARTSALTAFSGRDDFIEVTTSFKRVMNILEQARKVMGDQPLPGVRETYFDCDDEKTLHAETVSLSGAIDERIREKQYVEILSRMAAIRPAVDRYFDNVMVMVEDEKIKQNRLSLLTGLGESFLKLVDFRRVILPK